MSWKGHRKEPTKKTRIENAPRDYHVDALPYPAFALEITSFRYSSIRERRSLAPLRRRSRSDAPYHWTPVSQCRLIRNSPPAIHWASRVIQRMSPPRTVGMIAKRRFCVNWRRRNGGAAVGEVPDSGQQGEAKKRPCEVRKLSTGYQESASCGWRVAPPAGVA